MRAGERMVFDDARVPERVWRYIHPCPMSGCWLAFGSDNGLGYQKIWIGGIRQYAHRALFEFAHGLTLGERELDHRCRTPSCCNPDHLEIVSRSENCRRGRMGQYDRSATPDAVHNQQAQWRARGLCSWCGGVRMSGRNLCQRCTSTMLRSRGAA